MWVNYSPESDTLHQRVTRDLHKALLELSPPSKTDCQKPQGCFDSHPSHKNKILCYGGHTLFKHNSFLTRDSFYNDPHCWETRGQLLRIKYKAFGWNCSWRYRILLWLFPILFFPLKPQAAAWRRHGPALNSLCWLHLPTPWGRSLKASHQIRLPAQCSLNIQPLSHNIHPLTTPPCSTFWSFCKNLLQTPHHVRPVRAHLIHRFLLPFSLSVTLSRAGWRLWVVWAAPWASSCRSGSRSWIGWQPGHWPGCRSSRSLWGGGRGEGGWVMAD